MNGPGNSSVSGCYPWQHVACSNGVLYCSDCEGVSSNYVGGWEEHTFAGCSVGFYRASCRSGCFAPPGGSAAGSCVPCTNALGANNFQYTSEGVAHSDLYGGRCAWECNPGFVKVNLTVMIGNICARHREECMPQGVPQALGCNSSTWTATIEFLEGMHFILCN